jgi:capsid assembly protease
MKYGRIYRAFCAMPWMIDPVKLEAFAELLVLRMEGGQLSPDEILSRTAHPKKGLDHEMSLLAINANAVQAASGAGNLSSGGNVAVLPIYGVISHRASMDISGGGGFNIQGFRQRFRQALDEPSISTIVLDVDSPGGSVDGVDELAKEIHQARGQKKIVAVANTLAASAAYYIASAADEFVVTPSGEVGSIGVYRVHQDASGFYSQKGIVPTLIKAGKFKTEGNPFGPLDDEASTALQANVDAYYDMFVKAVARNRGVAVDAVRNGFGEGRTVMAKEAVKLGMADRVATLDEVLTELTGRKSARKKASAQNNAARLQMEIDLLESE